MLCIVSGEPLRPDAIAAFQAAVSANNNMTIVVDRRRAGAGLATYGPERRRRPSVAVRLKTDGFAIVEESTGDSSDVDPPWVERLSDEHRSRDTDGETDEREIRRVLESRRRRRIRVAPLVLWGLGAGLVLVGIIARVPVEVPAPVEPPVVDTPAPLPRRSVSPPAEKSPSTKPDPAPSRAEPVRKPSTASAPPSTATRPAPSPVSPPASPPVPPPVEPTREAVGAPQAPAAASPLPPAAASVSSSLPQTGPPPETGPSPQTGRPSPSAEPARSARVNAPPPRSHTTAVPGQVPAPPTGATASSTASTSGSAGSAQSRPIGLDVLLRDQVSRDVDEARGEAKRQFEEMRRMWNNARHVFGRGGSP